MLLSSLTLPRITACRSFLVGICLHDFAKDLLWQEKRKRNVSSNTVSFFFFCIFCHISVFVFYFFVCLFVFIFSNLFLHAGIRDSLPSLILSLYMGGPGGTFPDYVYSGKRNSAFKLKFGIFNNKMVQNHNSR